MFGSEREIEVYSDVFNLAGDIKDRTNFLKAIMIDQALFHPHASYAESIRVNYANGIGVNMRRIVPFANRINYYDTINQSKTIVKVAAPVPSSDVRDTLQFLFGYPVNVYDFTIGAPNMIWWASQYLLENFPERLEEVYDAEEEDGTIWIYFFNTPTDIEPVEQINTGIPASVLEMTADYLYVVYATPVEEGEPVVEEEEQDSYFPVAGWGDPIQDVTESVDYTWNRVTKVVDVYPEYEDEQEFVLPITEPRDVIRKSYKKVTNVPAEPGQLESSRIDEYVTNSAVFHLEPSEVTTEEDLGDFTRITTIYDNSLVPAEHGTYRKETTLLTGLNDQKIFIYKRGTGTPLLDALFSSGSIEGDMFPIVPIKYDTKPGTSPRPVYIDENSTGQARQVYLQNKKMLRKIGDHKTYKEILEALQDTEDHEDINYVYVFHGASMNTPDNSAKKYIFEFFRAFGSPSPESANQYQSYSDAYDTAHASRLLWSEWDDAQSDPSNPLFGTHEPLLLPYPTAPRHSVRFNLNPPGINLNLDYTVHWMHIQYSEGEGVRENLKMGEVKLISSGTLRPSLEISVVAGIVTKSFRTGRNGLGSVIEIVHQKTETEWESFHVYGLASENIIHRGESIFITGKEAIDDEEGESSFLIPLHEIPFRQMRLIDATQFGSASMYLMVNYYTDVKKKWYQTSAFKVVIVIATVVATVVFGPAGGAGVQGVGGAVAVAVGLTGVAAIVMSVAVNAIVGMIVTRLISRIAVEVFGDEIGMIVGAIVSVIAMNSMNNYFNGTQTTILDNFKPANLLKMTEAVTKNYTQSMQAEVEKMAMQMQEMQQEFSDLDKQLNALYEEEFGNNPMGAVDLLRFTEEARMDSILNEPSSFFARSLLTGSEIAELSMNSISNSLNLDHMLT